MKKIIVKSSHGNVIKELDQDINKTLIKQLTDSGVEVMSACHHGICGACIYNIESGHSNVQKAFKGEPGFPLGDDEVMTCIAGIGEGDDDIILTSNS